jgi:hypothetical protein
MRCSMVLATVSLLVLFLPMVEANQELALMWSRFWRVGCGWRILFGDMAWGSALLEAEAVVRALCIMVGVRS